MTHKNKIRIEIAFVFDACLVDVKCRRWANDVDAIAVREFPLSVSDKGHDRRDDR